MYHWLALKGSRPEKLQELGRAVTVGSDTGEKSIHHGHCQQPVLPTSLLGPASQPPASKTAAWRGPRGRRLRAGQDGGWLCGAAKCNRRTRGDACKVHGAQCRHTQLFSIQHTQPVHNMEPRTQESHGPDPIHAQGEGSPSRWGQRQRPASLPPHSPPLPLPHTKPRAGFWLSSLLLLAKTESQWHNGPASPAQITCSSGAFQRLGPLE